METLEIALEDLVLDPNLSLRDRLDDATVERYAESWAGLPPVSVIRVEGRYLLADGFHRHAAAARLNRRTIAAEVREGSFPEALDLAALANLKHGLPLTRAERRRAVEVLLTMHHDRSDRRLCEELGVGRDLVAKVRRQLIDGKQIPDTPGRLGADGKLYPSAGLPKDPNERLPRGQAVAQQDEPVAREAKSPPWDDAPSAGKPPPKSSHATPPWEAGGDAPWESADAKAVALSPPVAPAAPTIDEMLDLMTRQVNDLVAWTEAEGFAEAYRTAGPAARKSFQTAALRLAARADDLAA